MNPKEFRKHMRQLQTPAEKSLWYALRAKRFQNHKFRRQHTIGPYTVDIFSPKSKSFDSEEECLKAAEKLLNEKVKKGYSENDEVVVTESVDKKQEKYLSVLINSSIPFHVLFQKYHAITN